MTDNARKSSRISRLVQPRKLSYIHPEKRSLSEDNNKNIMQASSGSKLKRSRSVINATPLKTPMRTPLRTPRRTNCHGTVENDQRHINEQAKKVLEYMRSSSTSFGSDFLSGGLRSLTTKQFIAMMEHFAKTITGTRFTIGSNPQDDMIKFLAHVEYPYIVAKSSLKTPNVPHYYGAIVEILYWLCEFVQDDNSCEYENVSNLFDIENIFPDQQYMKMFIDSVKKSYYIWNKGEEDSTFKVELINDFIRTHTGLKSLKEIESITAQVKRDYDELIKKRFIVQNDNVLREKQLKNEQYKIEIKDIGAECEIYQCEVNELVEGKEDKQNEHHQLEQNISELKKRLADQTITTNDMEQMVTDLNYKKQLIKSKNDEVNCVDDQGFTNQMLFAKLLKQNTDITGVVNCFLSKLIQNADTNISIDGICLPTESTENLDEIVNLIGNFLDRIRAEKLENKLKIQAEIHQCTDALDQHRLEQNIRIEKNIEFVKRKTNFETQIDAVNRSNEENQINIYKYLEELQGKLDALVKCIRELSEKQEKLENDVNRLHAENVEVLCKIKETGHELIEKKRLKLIASKALHDKLKEKVKKLNEKFSNF